MEEVDWEAFKKATEGCTTILLEGSNFYARYQELEHQLIDLLDNHLDLTKRNTWVESEWAWKKSYAKEWFFSSPLYEVARRILANHQESQLVLTMNKTELKNLLLVEFFKDFDHHLIENFEVLLETYRNSPHTLSANQHQFMDQLLPLLDQLAELWAGSLEEVILTFEDFWNHHLNTHQLEQAYQNERSTVEGRVRIGLNQARQQTNPSFRELGELMLNKHYYPRDIILEKMERYVVFEEFLEELMEPPIPSSWGETLRRCKLECVLRSGCDSDGG
jgi:hypothetical protein